MNKTQCRLSHDAYHVDYVLKEDLDSVETRNWTHKKITSSDDLKDGEFEYGFGLHIENNKAQLFTGSDEDLDIQHSISETTCFQLADMFYTVAVLLREKRRDAEIEAIKIKQEQPNLIEK